MLSLKPPFLEVGNLMIYADDADNATFYYACQCPSIAKDDKGEPLIAATCILPESGAKDQSEMLEATLNLDVELSLSDKERKEAEDAIKHYYGVTPKIFSPVPLHDGQVRFVMAQADDKTDTSKWFVTSRVTPSMSGTNRVSLIVRANGDDAKRLIAAAVEGTVPACVYYELGLVGMTPVYHASVIGDLNAAYHKAREYQMHNYRLVSSEVDKIVTDLIDEKVLVVQVEETDPDIKAEALSNLMSELRQRVLEHFFEPVEFAASSEKMGTTAGSVRRVLHSIFGGSYTLKTSIDETIKRTIKIDLSQKNAKVYHYCPQALLDSMIQSAGISMEDRIRWVSLDNMPFKAQEVNLRVAPEAFESNNLKSVEVECRVVDAESGEILFVPRNPPIPIFGSSCLNYDFYYHSDASRNVAYEFKMTLHSQGTGSLPARLPFDWMRTVSPYVYINPGEYLTLFELQVAINDPSVFLKAHTIQAIVEVVNKKGAVVRSETFFFTEKERDNKHLTVLASKDEELRYSVELLYFMLGSKDHCASYTDLEQQFFVIPNPFEKQWTVDLKCHADWEKISRVYLDTRFQDAERVDIVEDSFEFSEDQPNARMVVQCSPDTPSREFEYKMFVDYQDGRSVTCGWYRHRGNPTLHLKADVEESERMVCFQLSDKSIFVRRDIKSVELVIYRDGEEIDKIPLTSAEDQWEYACRPAESRFLYQIRVKKTNFSPVPAADKLPMEEDAINIQIPVIR